MLLLNLLAGILAFVSVNAISIPPKTGNSISLPQRPDIEAIESAKKLGAMCVQYLEEYIWQSD